MNFNFVGYGNFTQILLSESDFVTNLIDYVVSTVISVPIIVVFALIISMMLNQKIKGKGFFRLIFFLPVIIVSGPILGMLNAQGAGSITSIVHRQYRRHKRISACCTCNTYLRTFLRIW